MEKNQKEKERKKVEKDKEGNLEQEQEQELEQEQEQAGTRLDVGILFNLQAVGNTNNVYNTIIVWYLQLWNVSYISTEHSSSELRLIGSTPIFSTSQCIPNLALLCSPVKP